MQYFAVALQVTFNTHKLVTCNKTWHDREFTVITVTRSHESKNGHSIRSAIHEMISGVGLNDEEFM
jgi:hypothetical protein